MKLLAGLLLVPLMSWAGPLPTLGFADRPLREIGRVRSSPYCTSFTVHYNAAVVPILKNDASVGLIDRAVDELEAHFGQLGGDVRIYNDRLRLADAVHRMQDTIPRAQSEINLLREGAKLGGDPERSIRMRDLAGELQRALDKHKQIAHDVGNVVHVLMDIALSDPGEDSLASVRRSLAPETPAVAAPALTGALPVSSAAPLGTTLKDLLRWNGQRDRIDEAEAKAAAHADQMMTAWCGPTP